MESRVGEIDAEGPPVPIPNTEVKLCRAEDTWLATARENRYAPTWRRRLDESLTSLRLKICVSCETYTCPRKRSVEWTLEEYFPKKIFFSMRRDEAVIWSNCTRMHSSIAQSVVRTQHIPRRNVGKFKQIEHIKFVQDFIILHSSVGRAPDC